MLSHPRRKGFSKIDLIVLLFVAFVVFCCFAIMPSQDRLRHRRAQCLSNLKNVALALLTFEVRTKSFPPGLPNCKTDRFYQVEGDSTADCQGPNWLSQILSDLEEKRNFDDLMTCLDDNSVKNACNDCPQLTLGRVGTITPQVLICPNSELAQFEDKFSKYGVPSQDKVAGIALAKSSYAANFGAESYISSLTNPELAGTFPVVPISPPKDPTNKRWMFASNKGTRFSEIVDGSSKTVLVSEIVSVDSPEDARGVWT